MNINEHFIITGRTEKGGQSHNAEFVITKPHSYPLFKGHKLTKEDFENKKIPPHRMVTAAINGPTYRLGMFLNHILQPISDKYCEGEMVRDTTHFIQELKAMKESSSLPENDYLMGTLDVDALYPNIDRSLALGAIEHAVRSCTDYPDQVIQTIIDLCRFCLNNSVVHFRGRWFRSDEGVPTGGPESGSIANIYVKWMLDQHLLLNPVLNNLNKMSNRKRFLDDIWFIWLGTRDQFQAFKQLPTSLVFLTTSQ